MKAVSVVNFLEMYSSFSSANQVQFHLPLKMSCSTRLSRLEQFRKTTLIILLKCVHTSTIQSFVFSLRLSFQVGLARAARTDAGVHAAGNVVSLKMIITIPGVEDLVASINEQLPPAIRV